MNNSQKFQQVLIHLGEQEDFIENVRLQVVESEYFTLYRAFQAIDVNNNNQITKSDLTSLVQLDCTEVIRYYAEYKADVLSFANFMNICLPKTNAQLRKLLTSKVVRTIEKQEQEMVSEAMKILFSKEYELFEGIQSFFHAYNIELHSMFNYPIKKVDLAKFFGNKRVNIDSIWRRLNYENRESLNLQDLQNIFCRHRQGQIVIDQTQQPNYSNPLGTRAPSDKLDWMKKKNCVYHGMKRVKNPEALEKTHEILRNYSKSIVRELLILMKEYSQAERQISQIKEKLQRFDLEQAFSQMSKDRLLSFEQTQQFLGQQLLLEHSDFELLLKFVGGVEWDDFARCFPMKRQVYQKNLEQIKIYLLKLIFLLKLQSFLKQSFKKKSLIREEDVIAEFGRFTPGNILRMAREVSVSLEEDDLCCSNEILTEFTRQSIDY